MQVNWCAELPAGFSPMPPLALGVVGWVESMTAFKLHLLPLISILGLRSLLRMLSSLVRGPLFRLTRLAVMFSLVGVTARPYKQHSLGMLM